MPSAGIGQDTTSRQGNLTSLRQDWVIFIWNLGCNKTRLQIRVRFPCEMREIYLEFTRKKTFCLSFCWSYPVGNIFFTESGTFILPDSQRRKGFMSSPFFSLWSAAVQPRRFRCLHCSPGHGDWESQRGKHCHEETGRQVGLLESSVADPDPNPDPDPHVFGPPGSDPLVRGMDPDPDPALDPDPDPSAIMQK